MAVKCIATIIFNKGNRLFFLGQHFQNLSCYNEIVTHLPYFKTKSITDTQLFVKIFHIAIRNII
jgi:hypothetical protein